MVRKEEPSENCPVVTPRNIEHLNVTCVDALCSQYVVDRNSEPTRPGRRPGSNQALPTLVGSVRAANHVVTEHRIVVRGVEISSHNGVARQAPSPEQTKVAPPSIDGIGHRCHGVKRDKLQPPEVAPAQGEVRKQAQSSPLYVSRPDGGRNQYCHALNIGFSLSTRGP